MKRLSCNRLSWLMLLVGSMLIAPSAQASDSERHASVDGIEVYLGVVPSAIIQDHPEMHGNKAQKKHRYHVLVALFDSNTGERIIDAKVKASVMVLGLTGATRGLEPMHGEPVSYGNYFTMPQPGQYRIGLEIRLPGIKGLTKVNFVYRRPQD